MDFPAKTQFLDTFIGGEPPLPAVDHQNERTARQYAAELTSRKQGECRVLIANGGIAVYENGEERV